MTDEVAAGEGERLRAQVTTLLQRGQAHAMIAASQELLDREPGPRTHRFLHRLAKEARGTPTLKPVKVALLSSFSIEFMQDALVALGVAQGLGVEIFQAGFGAFRQALLDQDSALHPFAPDVVVLAVEGATWSPAAYADYLATPAEQHDDVVNRMVTEVRALIAALRRRSTAPLLIHNFALPAYPALGMADAKAAGGQGAMIARLNAELAALAREAIDVHIVDYAALVNRHGARNWYDDRMRLYARSPIANAMLPKLAGEYVKFLCAFGGLTKKCLVVDLDNTLWGGVIGEDGVDGIKLGPDYPGSAYVEFQHYLRDLSRRGVLLAIASKNNSADVDEVFARHPAMALGLEHFAEREIHWEPKSRSLARIAQRLSIGLEHMVFVDDNPAECAEVRRALPMVRVIELPPQPERFAAILQDAALFDTLQVSAEDMRRGELYQQRAAAEAARGEFASIDDFYRELAMEFKAAPVDQGSLARTAELTRKTNQFNVTTVRYTEAEVAQRAGDPLWTIATIRVSDRFGDNGIVGVVMAHQDGTSLEVDTFLMSCRVIGRTVETAMLAYLCDEARRRGAHLLRATVVPTAKNMPARALFADHGFTRTGEDTTGTTHWQLDLRDAGVDWPAWFKRIA